MPSLCSPTKLAAKLSAAPLGPCSVFQSLEVLQESPFLLLTSNDRFYMLTQHLCTFEINYAQCARGYHGWSHA